MKNRHAIIVTMFLAACESSTPVTQEAPRAVASEEVVEAQPVASVQPDQLYANCACIDFEDNVFVNECFTPPVECSDVEVSQCVVE